MAKFKGKAWETREAKAREALKQWGWTLRKLREEPEEADEEEPREDGEEKEESEGPIYVIEDAKGKTHFGLLPLSLVERIIWHKSNAQAAPGRPVAASAGPGKASRSREGREGHGKS
jgi:hypothetical protein